MPLQFTTPFVKPRPHKIESRESIWGANTIIEKNWPPVAGVDRQARGAAQHRRVAKRAFRILSTCERTFESLITSETVLHVHDMALIAMRCGCYVIPVYMLCDA